MNKILPIILVVVLSGCGNSAIENCADTHVKKSGSFESKLKSSRYASAAFDCEILQNKAPETFKARYK